MERVAVVNSLQDGDLEESVDRALDLIGLPPLPSGATIAVKPNLGTDKSPDSGDTTDVSLIEAIIKVLRKRFPNCHFVIVESDSMGTFIAKAFDELGYVELCERLNVKLVNLSRDKRNYLKIRDGDALSTLTVPETLLFAGFFISVPKLKTHSNEKITCALKNQFGCIPRKNKEEYHPFMSGVLADLNRVYRPDLIIVDGIVGMEGFGPSDGTPRNDGIIICGKDPVAVDAVAARLMGFNPSKVPSWKFAYKHGIGEGKNIEVVGNNPKVKPYAFIPKKVYVITRLFLKIQRYGARLQKLGCFLLKVRSLTCLIGISSVSKRLSLRDMLSLAREHVLKLDA